MYKTEKLYGELEFDVSGTYCPREKQEWNPIEGIGYPGSPDGVEDFLIEYGQEDLTEVIKVEDINLYDNLKYELLEKLREDYYDRPEE